MIEHTALNVSDPHTMATWYEKAFGLQVIRRVGDSTLFLADESRETILEIYHNPASETLDFETLHPLQLHLAFISTDVDADVNRLLQLGASLYKEKTVTEQGDFLAMLKDPWGLPVQLVQRAEQHMIK